MDEKTDFLLELAPFPIQGPLGMGVVTDQQAQLLLEGAPRAASYQLTQLFLVVAGDLNHSKSGACSIADRLA